MGGSQAGVLSPAPPLAQSGGGGGGGWAWLFTARDAMEAEIVRGLLEAAGVPVALDLRDPSPFAWMHLSGNMHRPVPVYVPSGLIDEARLELLETGLSAPEVPEPSPPRAGFRSRHRLVWMAISTLTVVAVAWILIVEMFGFAPCALHLFCF